MHLRQGCVEFARHREKYHALTESLKTKSLKTMGEDVFDVRVFKERPSDRLATINLD
jgi:hypothetical protein